MVSSEDSAPGCRPGSRSPAGRLPPCHRRPVAPGAAPRRSRAIAIVSTASSVRRARLPRSTTPTSRRLRPRSGGRHPRAREGARVGGGSLTAHCARSCASRRGTRDCAAGGRRTRGGAPAWHRASRPVARPTCWPTGRRGQAPRLRPGEALRRRLSREHRSARDSDSRGPETRGGGPPPLLRALPYSVPGCLRGSSLGLT